jgi:hypothetical protein
MVADRRDHLDLQVNLLTEQRATQITKCSTGLAHGWASITTITRLAASWHGMSPSNTLSKSCTAGCPSHEPDRAMFDKDAPDEFAAMLAVGTVAAGCVRRIAGRRTTPCD